ncbi:ATP-dependent DNA ligase domain protein [Ostertagia ostertagi]
MASTALNYAIRILIIDDDEDDYLITSEYIKHIPAATFQIDWCYKYDEALDLMCSNQYDLYFTDYRLGAKSGAGALAEELKIKAAFICSDVYEADKRIRHQTRITRKHISKKQLEEAPVVFMAYDLLEYHGNDMRQVPLSVRRNLLEKIIGEVQSPQLVLSPLVTFNEWQDLNTLMKSARERGCEGFMLKRKYSIYQAGRRRGDWWKWKVDPMSIDAVMIYAQKGHGKRGNLYTDYTFAVRDGEQLVSFAKAYSGLTDKEIARVDHFVKHNSVEQFGPVRTVVPRLVFEIAFEGISASARHKSGVAVRFPRILRWREDKTVDDINTIEDLKQLLDQYGKGG